MSMIDVSGLTFSYEGSPETIFDHVSFQIDTDWKLGFTGINGRGKTTFLRLLMGAYPYEGTISASVELSTSPIRSPRRRGRSGRLWRRWRRRRRSGRSSGS